MSNYPPGMTSRDFVRAGIDQPHHHEHEWEYVSDDDLTIEDGAAIFRQRCRYAEGEYGQGWECEEGRHYRFEYDTLVLVNGDEVELPTIDDWGEFDDDVGEVVIAIEEAYHSAGTQRPDLWVDPDKHSGEVEIEYLGYTLRYEPQ